MLHKLIPSQSFYLFLIVSIVFSLTAGTMASLAEVEYAHQSNEVFAFTGTAITRLNPASLQSLGTPASVSCGADACVQDIDPITGQVACAQPSTGYFGAGSCEQEQACIPGTKKGCPNTVTWKCTHVTEPNPGCEGELFWAYQHGGSDGALDAARASAGNNCCPEGTSWGAIGPSAMFYGKGSGYKGYHCS